MNIEIYTPSVKSSTSHYVQNVAVYVLVCDPTKGELKSIRSPCIVETHCLARRVDRRYKGPRSAYGRAMAQARTLADELRQSTPLDIGATRA